MVYGVSFFQGCNISQKIRNYADTMAERNWIKVISTPLSWLYGLITNIRNLLYDKQIFRSERPSQFTLSVGNITVGGTGKTPMTEYLVRLLSNEYPTAILSRGYGRKTKGFVLAKPSLNADAIGDEPLQYFEKFGDSVVVAVCEKRVNGAREIAKIKPDIKLLLLDDAFQHRAIIQDLKLILTDYYRPFYEDLPFPAGRLRETRAGAQRADAIIVTKCPTTLVESQKKLIVSGIRKYSKYEAPVFFSYIQYGAPVSYNGSLVTLNNVKLVAGIANPATFSTHIKQRWNVIEEIIYPDHHNYSTDDLKGLIKYLKNDTFVVTTEKDMVKLKPLVEEAGVTAQFVYIPIVVDFKNDTSNFDGWIRQQTQNIH
jgi:tetraacyldisaccharide 4'-kinase